MADKITISAKVDAEVIEELDKLADRIGWSRSELVSHCIVYGLREGKKFADRIEGPVLGHLLRMVFMLDVDNPKDRKAFDEMFSRVQDQRKRRSQIKGKLA